MTRQRNDDHSTEFGIWLRKIKEIDSSLGFTATNIDYIWHNYKTGDWMLIEEKRYNRDVSFTQKEMFKLVNKAIKNGHNSKKYRGFHLLVFEKTSPEDGKVFLDRKEVTKEELLKFLKTFQMPNT